MTLFLNQEIKPLIICHDNADIRIRMTFITTAMVLFSFTYSQKV